MKLLKKIKGFFELLYLLKSLIIITAAIIVIIVDVVIQIDFPLFLVAIFVFLAGLLLFQMEVGCRAP